MENLQDPTLFKTRVNRMYKLSRETTPTVDAVGKLDFDGNIIPHLWYQNIVMENGKPDLIAIILLAETCYWYRPTYLKDELTGKVVSVKRKFDSDMWQRTSQSLADQFGLSHRQVTDALSRLEKYGLIKREFRNFRSKSGIPMSNVQFIEPVVDKLIEITYGSSNELLGGESENTSPLVTEGGTYTDIPSENPTDILKDEKNSSRSHVTTHENNSEKSNSHSSYANITDDPFEDKNIPKVERVKITKDNHREETLKSLTAYDGKREGVASPKKARDTYAKEVSQIFASTLGHEEPSDIDRSAARECFDKKFPIDRVTEFCQSKQPYYLQAKADGKSPSAYWIKRDFDEWRVNGYGGYIVPSNAPRGRNLGQEIVIED